LFRGPYQYYGNPDLTRIWEIGLTGSRRDLAGTLRTKIQPSTSIFSRKSSFRYNRLSSRQKWKREGEFLFPHFPYIIIFFMGASNFPHLFDGHQSKKIKKPHHLWLDAT